MTPAQLHALDPDRCEVCGYHKPTQGDACNGTLKWEQPTDEWSLFVAALRKSARDGEVHQRDVRPLIRGRIEPKHIGQFYAKAIRERLIHEVRRERSDDEVGRNTNKWEPVYRMGVAA